MDSFCYTCSLIIKIMTTDDWRELANQELEMARSARQNGNEGRARVCARRAAGYVIGEYLLRNEIDLKTDSALERSRYLHASQEISSMQRETIGHFLVHTTPDHNLPIDADLISDVELLAHQLLGESLL